MGAFEHISCTFSARRKLVQRQKEPDCSFVPLREAPGAFPSVVFEVASKNESYGELKREIQEWVEGPELACMAIGINVTIKDAIRRKPKRLGLKAFYMRRGDATIADVIDFSKVESMGEAVITISANDLFNGDVPSGVKHALTFDLYPIKMRLAKFVR